MPRPTVLYCNKVKHHCTANKTNHLSTDVALIQTRHTRQTLHTRSTRHTTPTVPVIQAHQSHHAQHAHQEHHAHQAHQAHQARKATVLCTDQATKTAMYCTVLYCTVLYCTVLYCTVTYCTHTTVNLMCAIFVLRRLAGSPLSNVYVHATQPPWSDRAHKHQLQCAMKMKQIA